MRPPISNFGAKFLQCIMLKNTLLEGYRIINKVYIYVFHRLYVETPYNCIEIAFNSLSLQNCPQIFVT